MQSLAGTMWKLVAVSASDEQGREVPSPIGLPQGFTMFGEDRILSAVADARPPQPPGAPPRVFFSYTGTYRFDGRELVSTADAASRPELVTEHVRDVRFEGPRRVVVTPKNSPLSPSVRLAFVWEQVE